MVEKPYKIFFKKHMMEIIAILVALTSLVGVWFSVWPIFYADLHHGEVVEVIEKPHPVIEIISYKDNQRYDEYHMEAVYRVADENGREVKVKGNSKRSGKLPRNVGNKTTYIKMVDGYYIYNVGDNIGKAIFLVVMGATVIVVIILCSKTNKKEKEKKA